MSAGVTLKVSAKSSPNAVAGALAAALRERDSVEVQAVGAGAINQAIKAVAMKGAHWDAVCRPSFVLVSIGESERTAISLMVERRKLDEKAEEEKAQQIED